MAQFATDLTRLTYLDIGNNPDMMTVFVPHDLAVAGLSDEVAELRSRGVSVVHTYPTSVNLLSARQRLDGAFELTLASPPGTYTILGSPDLAAWSQLGTLTNLYGYAVFTDAMATNSFQKFYRVQTPP